MKSEFVLLTSRKSGFLKRDVCIISFFKDEILITSLDNAKQKELFMAKKNAEKQSGGGLFKQTLAMQTAITDYVDMIKNMEKNDILKEKTEIIKKESVTKLKFSPASKIEDYENNTSSLKEGKIIIYINEKKLKFKHLYEDKNKEIKKYLHNCLQK